MKSIFVVSMWAGKPMSEEQKPGRDTRYLDSDASAPPMPPRSTSPLEVMPWVLEFRVVGTPSIIQVQVAEAMILGRRDDERGVYPHVDLGPYEAHSKGVSRQHAVILAKDNRIKIKDLNSANGTKLNGYALTPGHEYRLRHGDELTVGEIRLQVLFAVTPAQHDTQNKIKPINTVIPQIGNGRKVLIVEDDSDVANVFTLILEQAGYTVISTNSAVTALGYITQEMPYAIVLDLMLPDLSGLDFARYLRKQDDGSQPKVIVVSGATGGFQMNEALKAGADMFLGKPVSVDELVEAFKKIDENAAASEETKPLG
jgi:CheY-like chemotaxis protein